MICHEYYTDNDVIDKRACIPPHHIVSKKKYGLWLCVDLHSYCLQKHIREIMQKMSSKTCDLDPISTSLLFQCMDEIALVLTDIVNECLCTGSVPDSLKRAIVQSLQNKASPDPNILKISDLC